MTNPVANYPEDFADENYCADGDVGLATLDADAATPVAAEYTGPCCEKCEAPLKPDVVTICRNYGWYGSLGTFVELNPNWETALDESAPAAAAQPAPHLRAWLGLVPRWGWVIICSVAVVIVESITPGWRRPPTVHYAPSGRSANWRLVSVAPPAVTCLISCRWRRMMRRSVCWIWC